MPLRHYPSLCDKNARYIVSRDKGGRQYHKGININNDFVTHYKIDDVVISKGIRCDYLLINEDKRRAYLIELKGSDLVKAAEQLEATEKTLRSDLIPYDLFYRIIANKCLTHSIHSSEYRKYQLRWGKKLLQKTGCIEEVI